jgi:hypothetical protein
MVLDGVAETWQKMNRKQTVVHEREAPLRNQLLVRMLYFASAALALQTAVLWWVGVNPGWFVVYAGASLVVAVITRTRHTAFALTALFCGIFLTVASPGSKGFVYPQHGAALVLEVIIAGLLFGALSNGSLLDAMEQVGRKLTSDSGVQLDTRLEGQPYALPEQCEANLLRIAQEALTNAVRHSGKQRIGIRLAYRTGSVELEVGDSGRGMTGAEPS